MLHSECNSHFSREGAVSSWHSRIGNGYILYDPQNITGNLADLSKAKLDTNDYVNERSLHAKISEDHTLYYTELHELS